MQGLLAHFPHRTISGVLSTTALRQGDGETKSNQKMSVAHQKAMGTIWIVSCDHSQGHLGTGAQAQVSEDHTSRGDQLQYLGVQTIVRLEEETAFETCGWEQCGGTQPSGGRPS